MAGRLERSQPVPPILLLVTGVGGSGKSGVCEKLLEVIDADYLSKDVVADRITQSRGPDYVAEVRDGVYQQIFEEAARCLSLGRSVIIDASFRKELARDGWQIPYQELTDQYGAVMRIARMMLSPEDLRQRIEARKSPYDSHKLISEQTWQEWLVEEPIYMPMPVGTLYVDNSDGQDVALAQVLQFIGINSRGT